MGHKVKDRTSNHTSFLKSVLF